MPGGERRFGAALFLWSLVVVEVCVSLAKSKRLRTPVSKDLVVMAQPPKKPSQPAVRGRPQTGSTAGRGAPPPQSKDGRTVSLEAGKALQRVLDTAPNAGRANKGDGLDEKAQAGLAAKVLAAAATVELHIAALPISQELVNQRVEELRRLISMTQPRAFGTHIQAGDEVELDLLGYVEGKLFVAQQGAWFDIRPNVFLPGLFEQLIGVAPPDNVVIQLRVPDLYPVEEHRGKTAAFAITVRRAQKRILPDADDPIFLQLTQRSVKTRAALEKVLVEELTDERARLCVDEAKLSLLRELYIKIGVDDVVPDDLVDEELRIRWKKAIGDALAHQGISVEDQKRSLADYSTAAQRAEARRTVWEARVLEAVADAEGVEATEGEVHKMVEELAPNIRKGDVEGLLYQHAALSKELVKNLRLHRALTILLGKAKIAFDGTPKPIEKLFVPLPQSAPTSGSSAGSGGVTTSRGLKRPPSKG